MNIKVLIYSMLFLFSINASCDDSSEVFVIENDTVVVRDDEESEETTSNAKSFMKTSAKVGALLAAVLYSHYEYHNHCNRMLIKRAREAGEGMDLAPHRKGRMVVVDERTGREEAEKCPICYEIDRTLFHSASCVGQDPHAYCSPCLDEMYSRRSSNCPTCGPDHPLGLRGRHFNLEPEIVPWSTHVQDTLSDQWQFIKTHPSYIVGGFVAALWLRKGLKDLWGVEYDTEYFYHYKEDQKDYQYLADEIGYKVAKISSL